jgi:hypothetical protein
MKRSYLFVPGNRIGLMRAMERLNTSACHTEAP